MSMNNALQITYYFVFCIRRVLFVALSIFFINYPIMQVINLNLMNLFMIIYLSNVKPFIGRFRNRLEIFNDFAMINLTLMMMLFTDWVWYPPS